MPAPALLLPVLLSLAAHNTSEGKAVVDVGADGRVDVRVELVEPDLPELCDVDFGVSPTRRIEMEEKLDVCVSREFPRWLRLRLDGDECGVEGGRFHHGDGLSVVVEAFAVCAPPAGKTLTLDWGLFASSSLDHRATTTIRLPDGSEQRALLSKRKNKLVVHVPGASPPPAVVAGVVAVVAVAVVVVAVFFVVVVARRRKLKTTGALAPR